MLLILKTINRLPQNILIKMDGRGREKDLQNVLFYNFIKSNMCLLVSKVVTITTKQLCCNFRN